MKDRTMVRLATLGLLVAALTISSVSAAAAWDPWAITKTIAADSPLSSTTYAWTKPSVSGNYVAYTKTAHDAPYDSDVYVYDIRSGSSKRCSSTSTGVQGFPRVSGDWVVYRDKRNGNWDVYAYRISTGAEKRVTTNAASEVFFDIAGTRIAYINESDASVWTYDLANGTQNKWTTGVATTAIGIGSRCLAYLKASDKTLRVKDMRTYEEKTIATLSSGILYGVDVDGHYVVWSQDRGTSDYDIMFRDLNKSANVTAVAAAGPQYNPRLDGTRVIYTHQSATDFTAWAYDILVGKAVRLTSSADDELNPDIFGNTCVWHRSAASYETSIILGRLAAPELSISAPTTTGHLAPFKIAGRLTENGLPMTGRKVYLEWGSADYGWSQVAEATTSSDGNYSFSVTGLSSARRYRTRYNGSTYRYGMSTRLSSFSAVSASRVIKPKALLGRPSGPSSIDEDTYFTTRGVLKPWHEPEDTRPVRIKVYKRINGKYRYKTTYTPKLYDYSSYSKYTARIKLTSPGKWRIRAYYPTSSTNYKTYSTYRYITAE